MSKLFWLGDNKSSVEEFSRCGLFKERGSATKSTTPKKKNNNDCRVSEYLMSSGLHLSAHSELFSSVSLGEVIYVQFSRTYTTEYILSTHSFN